MPSTESKPAVALLETLLSYEDEDFVANAYRTLLGRAPDPDGMSYYLARLRSGTAKEQILTQINRGPEGRAHGVTVIGLNEALRRQKRMIIPALAGIMDFLSKNSPSPPSQPDSGAIANCEESCIPPRQDVIAGNRASHFPELLDAIGPNSDYLPPDLALAMIHRLNPDEHFNDVYQACAAIVKQSPIRKLRIYEDDRDNANFYLQLAVRHEGAGRQMQSMELYQLSLLFASTPTAHEHLGNIALRNGRHHQAEAHYKAALDLNSRSPWVYANLARSQELSGQYKESVMTICSGAKEHPRSQLLLSHIDGHIDTYWNAENQKLECVAISQDRNRLIDEYRSTVTYISDAYASVFRATSAAPVACRLNAQRVLIIGLTHDAAPQCFRYRIEQKVEQLRHAGYEGEAVAWHEHDAALRLINFADLIIFYRTPAFPGVLKLVEYAKALGKITFYELDDLLFEPFSVPPLETYGGQVSLSVYTSVTKDIGSHRAIANRCHYAIASTQPLLERLAPLVETQIGYLHRNGLDKYSRQGKTAPVEKGYLNLFYGSGTLAHNTDFIVEALPAISRLLEEHKDLKLTVMGYLKLPNLFLSRFETQVRQVPFTADIEIYWAYLSASDINLAVLHDDPLTACKSELKWFEAATFSIPSVVSRTRNYVDVIRHGIDGFVVCGEDEWYDTLKHLIGNPDVRRSIGNRAYERVNREYSVAAMAKNIDKILKEALAHHISNSQCAREAERMEFAK